MPDPKIIDLDAERGTPPEAEAISHVLDSVATYEALGEIRAIVAVAVLKDSRAYAGAFTGLRASERLMLIGALDSMKQALIDEGLVLEMLPDD